MFVNNINPVLFHLGPFAITWYGIIFASSVLLGFFIASHFAIKKKLVTEEEAEEFFIYFVVAAVVGSRVANVISEWQYYSQNPLEIFMIWHGGLAFHGGLIAVILAGWWYSKKHKKDFFAIADIIAIPFALGLGFGRIANFINGEFYGTITNFPWCVNFKGVEGCRHPVQLYESLKNFLIFGFLWYLKDKKMPKGFIFWSFIFLYGIIRFFLEYLKVVPQYFLGLTWGQIWCVPMIIVGGFMLVKLFGRIK